MAFGRRRGRGQKGRWLRLLATLVIAAVAAGAVVIALERFDPAPPAAPAASVMQAQPGAAPQLTPSAPATKIAEAAPDQAGKLQDSIPVVVEPEPSYDDVELEPPFMIVDGQSFTSGKWAISVRDVLGPHRDAVCLDKNEELFACGLHARAALSNLLRTGKVNCRVRLPPILGRFESSCTVGAADLAEALVGAGWVRPTGRDERLEAAMRKARDAQLGLWNGGWKIRQHP